MVWMPEIHKKSAQRSGSMADSYVELDDIPVMRVRADFKGKGPHAAFAALESKLPTLKGRKFYGVFRETSKGEEYYACVARIDSDNPDKMQLDTGTIPGGKYVRRRVQGWKKAVTEGQLPKLFADLAQTHGQYVGPEVFSVEFYRSQTELDLLIPVKASSPNAASGR